MSQYGFFSGPNAGKYGPEKAPYLDTFHAVFLQFAIFFTTRCLDVRSQDLLYFYLFEVLSIVLVSSSLQGRECVGLAVIFNKEREETFAVSCLTKLQKLCLPKIFNTGSTTKVNYLEFHVFIIDAKCT